MQDKVLVSESVTGRDVLYHFAQYAKDNSLVLNEDEFNMYALWTAMITRFQDVIGIADIHGYEVYDVIHQSPACFELSYVDVKTMLSMLSRPNLHKVVVQCNVHDRCARRSLNEVQSKENMAVSSDKMEWT